jgi:hypothetical protein
VLLGCPTETFQTIGQIHEAFSRSFFEGTRFKYDEPIWGTKDFATPSSRQESSSESKEHSRTETTNQELTVKVALAQYLPSCATGESVARDLSHRANHATVQMPVIIINNAYVPNNDDFHHQTMRSEASHPRMNMKRNEKSQGKYGSREASPRPRYNLPLSRPSAHANKTLNGTHPSNISYRLVVQHQTGQ